MRYRWILILVLALLPAFGAAQAPLQLHWERYDNIAAIQPDGSMRVAEQQTLVIDAGRLTRMTREFETGEFGRVTGMRVLEDGQAYRRSSDESPGTYSGFDDGSFASIQLFFRDPDATQHNITIEYTVNDALVAESDRVTLDWNFFWESPDAPEIRNGSVEVRLPATVSQDELDLSASGVPVSQRVENGTIRWDLAEPIQGQQLRVVTAFPRAVLAPDAAPGDGGTAANPAPAQPAPLQPAPGVPAQPEVGGAVMGGIALFFCCFIVLFVLIVAIIANRATARARRWTGGGWGRSSYGPSPWGTPPPPQRRRGGFFGFPPIIIAPPRSSRRPSGRPRDADPNAGRSGGGSSWWGRSGGSSSSWGKSSGRSTSWGRSGGSSSGWGGLGGGSRGGRSGGGGRRGGGRGGGGFG